MLQIVNIVQYEDNHVISAPSILFSLSSYITAQHIAPSILLGQTAIPANQRTEHTRVIYSDSMGSNSDQSDNME
jgi:hypothetical protein